MSAEVRDALDRWEASGGLWRVHALEPEAVIGLYTCGGGEEMERLRCAPGPELRAFLAGRRTSDGTT